MRLSTFKKAFGANVKKQRIEKNLTQSELAEKLGIDTSSLGRMECGINFVSARMLLKISSALEINPAELFNFGNKINGNSVFSNKIEQILELLFECDEETLEYLYNILISALKMKK